MAGSTSIWPGARSQLVWSMWSNNRRAISALVEGSKSGVISAAESWSVIRSVEPDHTTDVAAGVHVLVSLVDLVEGVLPGDQLRQLQLPGLVELDEPGHVLGRGEAAEEHALDALLEHRQFEEADR